MSAEVILGSLHRSPQSWIPGSHAFHIMRSGPGTPSFAALKP